MHYTVQFSKGKTYYEMPFDFSKFPLFAPANETILIIDEKVAELYASFFKAYRFIVVPSGEDSKNWEMIQQLSLDLLALDANRSTCLVAVGGGVVTDITGFLASVFMRGVRFGFVPTTLLGMVDASIGGKNGINIGHNKNMIGLVNQPEFILIDPSFLQTLDPKDWSCGFAEIIKYACIGDARLYQQLCNKQIEDYKNNDVLLNTLIAQCVDQKNKVVQEDEEEKNIRKMLNFGHTAGHAFETLYNLAHGEAVALGMVVAMIASEQKNIFDNSNRKGFVQLLKSYQLPTTIDFNLQEVLQLMMEDKKRRSEHIDFILLQNIGSALIVPLSKSDIQLALQTFSDENKS